uniref:2-C-methyl-D-erythritol 4-phosphate cytidylyltransferase n=1 Tax=uncultured Acetothermia bacterium TaxID=236499 RepID=H5S8X7_9BACT|nr:2-C-methyl-D-erythritol 4-phosphate cytidylyltransferase [uncultured Acetothermia bacterium]
MSDSISAIVLAAGRGTRLGADVPKAYLPLQGKPILLYSLKTLSQCALISELIVVIHPDDAERARHVLKALEKPVKVVFGGAQRQDSALAGVRAASGDFVLVHDAARPLVSPKLIERVIATMKAHRAAVPALPVADSLKRVSHDYLIIADVDRTGLFSAQTPQGGERRLLLDALERACAQGRSFPDEASALLAMSDVRAKVVPGEAHNIKITTEADLQFAERLAERLVQADA